MSASSIDSRYSARRAGGAPDVEGFLSAIGAALDFDDYGSRLAGHPVAGQVEQTGEAAVRPRRAQQSSTVASFGHRPGREERDARPSEHGLDEPIAGGILVSALADAGDPLEWGSTLLAARVGRLRTAMLAQLTDRSMPAARAELGRMARAGWLEPHGVTRGRWYAPTERLNAMQLHVPELMTLLAAGEQLSLFDEALAR